MIFKTPCFVRVENVEKRKELIEWLKDIGYDVCVCCSFNENQYLNCSNIERNGQLVGEVHGVYNCDEIPSTDIVGLFLEETTDYDCGTDIALFKALAAMNDENDYMQLFVDARDNSLYFSDSKDIGLSSLIYDKATAEEIIKHYHQNK